MYASRKPHWLFFGMKKNKIGNVPNIKYVKLTQFTKYWNKCIIIQIYFTNVYLFSFLYQNTFQKVSNKALTFIFTDNKCAGTQ